MTANPADEMAEIDAATIHEAQGKTGALPERIKPIDPSMKVSGPAFTVNARPGDNLAMHLAVEEAPAGSVLVVNAHNFLQAGAWGDILTAFAQKQGVLGLVIDGAVRDTQQLVDMGFPVFASGVSIRGTLKRDPGIRGESVTLDGTTIDTGDFIVGDRDGVVSVPADRLKEVLSRARDRAVTEVGYRSAIDEGASTVDLLGLASDKIRPNSVDK